MTGRPEHRGPGGIDHLNLGELELAHRLGRGISSVGLNVGKVYFVFFEGVFVGC